MTLVPSFEGLLQPLAIWMTAPSFETFRMLVAGWVFARRRTVTGMMQAAGVVGRKHHSAFHRFFAAASWSLDALGLAVFELLVPWLDARVLLALDDTLARKRGLKMFGVGMHHDPLLSTRRMALTGWGHSWVVLGVVLRFPFRQDRWFCLPVLFRLYLNKQAATRARRIYRTRPQLAVELLEILCHHAKSRAFHLVADSAYGGQSVLKHLPDNCDLTSRLHLDARLYDAPPPRQPGKGGRPRKRGMRLPTPRQLLANRARRATLELYGRRDRVRLADQQAHWHCASDQRLRVVAVEPLTGGRRVQAFYSTCHEATAEDLLTWYGRRWSIEQTFQETKGHLGFEQSQGWTRRAVERTAPLAMIVYSLIVLWFARCGHRVCRFPDRPWYPGKRHACFIDMLTTLRVASIRHEVIATPTRYQRPRKLLQTLENTVQLAA